MKLTMPLISRWNVFGPFFLTKKALINMFEPLLVNWLIFSNFLLSCVKKKILCNVFCKRSVENQ